MESFINRKKQPPEVLNTAVYVTFEGQKLSGQFSENLVLRIYEILFNSGGKISNKKDL